MLRYFRNSFKKGSNKVKISTISPRIRQESEEPVNESIAPTLASPISPELQQFIATFMHWCAGTVFECVYSDWYLDSDLDVHYLTTYQLSRWPSALTTCHHDYKEKFSSRKITILRDRLFRNACVFIASLMAKQNWNNSRVQWTAACVAVAEVTEEISFFFNRDIDEAMELLKWVVEFAYRDDGLLYRLCL